MQLIYTCPCNVWTIDSRGCSVNFLDLEKTFSFVLFALSISLRLIKGYCSAWKESCSFSKANWTESAIQYEILSSAYKWTLVNNLSVEIGQLCQKFSSLRIAAQRILSLSKLVMISHKCDSWGGGMMCSKIRLSWTSDGVFREEWFQQIFERHDSSEIGR